MPNALYSYLSPTPLSSRMLVGPRPVFLSPDIANGDLDGAKSDEFSGMRAEFTSREWFDCKRGRNNKRLFSWYGYHGGNMSWRNLMALIVKVHFPDQDDMRFPSKQERNDRSRGVCLTNLERCLLTKMFITTGLTFNKIADLWGCCRQTVSLAIEYWIPLWKRVSSYALFSRTLPSHNLHTHPTLI